MITSKVLQFWKADFIVMFKSRFELFFRVNHQRYSLRLFMKFVIRTPLFLANFQLQVVDV